MAVYDVAGAGADGRITKAIVLEDGNLVREYPSKQLSDPFLSVNGYGTTLREPIYDLDSLLYWAESHPTHSAALEQKALDVIADGLKLSQVTTYTGHQGEDTELDNVKQTMEWWESLFSSFTSIETLLAMWLDWETLGWGFLEIVRDMEGVVREIYHIPAHTMRASEDGYRFVQMRGGQLVWFKRYGLDKEYKIMATTGRRAPSNAKFENLANEVLEFRSPSRASFWYSAPKYISALGFISLAVAARDYNLQFFDNFREPRHVVFVSGLESDVMTTTREMANSWKRSLKDNPHSNIILPVVGNADIQVEQMTTEMSEGFFADLIELADSEILISHRMPPDRLGAVKRGLLGGDSSIQLNQIYKSGVVDKSQALLESRLQRFIDNESPYEALENYRVDFEDLDIADLEMDVDMASNLVSDNIITINEARMYVGRRPLDKYRHEGEDLTVSEFEVIVESQFAAQFEPEDGGGGRRFSVSDNARREVSKNGKRTHKSLEELLEAD